VLEPFRRLARWRRRHPSLPLVGDIRTRAGREAAVLRGTVKALGAELARQRCDAGFAGPSAALPPEPVFFGLGSRTCRQADIEGEWLRHWCRRLGIWPAYHRKVWEVCFIAQAAWEAGALAPGRRALGFAVGREALPSLFAAAGMEVVATDLPAGDARARERVRTGQHAGGGDEAARRALFRPGLLGAEEFGRRVSFRPADMRRIPPDLLRGGFDLVWSSCAVEHLGGLGRGADFVLEAMRCLRPGGVAVHTTEFNTDAAGGTLRFGSTVLYQRRHLDALARRLAEAGHRMLPLDDMTGEGVPAEGPLDAFVDLPPFRDAEPGALPPPHLRLSIRGFPATSAGIVVLAHVF
jgi:SAM-dependent methyltransferase